MHITIGQARIDANTNTLDELNRFAYVADSALTSGLYVELEEMHPGHKLIMDPLMQHFFYFLQILKVQEAQRYVAAGYPAVDQVKYPFLYHRSLAIPSKTAAQHADWLIADALGSGVGKFYDHLAYADAQRAKRCDDLGHRLV